MKSIIPALLLMTGAAAFGDSQVQAEYLPLGMWPSCTIAAGKYIPGQGLGCEQFTRGTEPGLVRLRLPAKSRATEFAFALDCDSPTIRVTGTISRHDDGDGWSTLTLNIGCARGRVTAIELGVDPVPGRAVAALGAFMPPPLPDAMSPSGSLLMNPGDPYEVPPSVLVKVDPEYTEQARRSHYEGTVVLSVMVGIDGKASDFRVVKSLEMGLNEKAIEAVGKWKFKPAVGAGRAVPKRATIEVNFRLLPNP